MIAPGGGAFKGMGLTHGDVINLGFKVHIDDIGFNGTFKQFHHTGTIFLKVDVAEPLIIIFLGIVQTLMIKSPTGFLAVERSASCHLCTITDKVNFHAAH